MKFKKWQNQCDCGRTKSKNAKCCRECMLKETGHYSRKKTMDKNEGLAWYQRVNEGKSHAEYIAEARIKSPITYRETKLHLL